MSQLHVRLPQHLFDEGEACGGDSPQPHTKTMGDTEQINGRNSDAEDAPASNDILQSDLDADWELGEADNSPGSLPPSEAKPQLRRSSLRPAPPSFRPSARDPSQLLRPAMVIHAGDVDPQVPLWDNLDPAPSHPSQPSVSSSLSAEPFALAEDYTPSELPILPPSAPIPVEAREPAKKPRSTLSHFGAPNRQSTPDALDGAPHVVEATVQADEPLPIAAADELPPSTSADSRSSIADAGSAKRLTNSHMAAILAAIVLAGVVVAMMLGRTNGTTPGSSSVAVRSDQVSPTPSAATPLVPTVVDPAIAAAAPNEATAPVVGSAEEPSAQPNVAASATPSAPPPQNTTRVALDVRPTDAKVIYQGKLQSGPPYEFDVPKGKRVALEVARFGFVTQKVVLDGKKSTVLVGLRHSPRGAKE